MLNIKDFIITNKQILIKDNILKSLFKKNLSSNEINILTSHIRNLLISRNEPIKNLYMYTYHNLDNEFKSHSALLRLQCTANNIYVQCHEDVPYTPLNNKTIIFYSTKHLYLTSNRIIWAYSGKFISSEYQSVAVMPESCPDYEVPSGIYGVCSDDLRPFRDKLSNTINN